MTRQTTAKIQQQLARSINLRGHEMGSVGQARQSYAMTMVSNIIYNKNYIAHFNFNNSN